MSTNYPGALDSFVNPTANDTLDSATVPHATQHADSNDAIEALQVTLGVNPQGGSATVVARLTALDSTVSGKAATNQTMYVGTTAIAINRSSASQTLTGTSIDGNAATATLATSASAVPASGITGATLASGVTASSLTSFGSSPALSGTPTTSTAAVDTNTTQVASTAFVLGQASASTPAMSGTAAVGTSTRYARADHVHGSDTTKANLAGATFTGAVAVSSGNLSQTGSGQVLVQSTSTSAVPLVVKPTGSLTITGLTATHSGGAGVAFDTVSGFSSTVGLVAGQSVVLSGFSDSNFNGTTTITVVSTTTIRVTSLQGTNGTGTGGQIVVTATQQNLQEWQYNSGTAVASVGASGKITATDLVDSSMTVAGIVTNTSAGLLGTTTTVPVANGGTGSTTAATARTNLEIAPSYVPFVSGATYRTVTGAGTTAAASSNNRLDFTSFYVATTTTFSNIGITSSTLTVSGTVRLGIYSDNAGVPGSKIYESSAITTAATGNTFITPTSFSQTLTPGWYWLAAVTQGVTGTFWMTQTANPSIAYNQRTTSQPTATYPSGVSGFQQTAVTGALPATGASALANVTNLLITFLVVA